MYSHNVQRLQFLLGKCRQLWAEKKKFKDCFQIEWSSDVNKFHCVRNWHVASFPWRAAWKTTHTELYCGAIQLCCNFWFCGWNPSCGHSKEPFLFWKRRQTRSQSLFLGFWPGSKSRREVLKPRLLARGRNCHSLPGSTYTPVETWHVSEFDTRDLCLPSRQG